MKTRSRFFTCPSIFWISCLLVLVGLLFSASARAQLTPRPLELPEIEYGYPDQSIFIASVNASGQVDTPMNHLASVLLDRVGVSWHAEAYPAARLFSNLKNGTTNFSILVRASSLADCCIFSHKPVFVTTLNAYAIGSKPKIEAREDLRGKNVILIRGYSYAGLLKYVSDPANQVHRHEAGGHRAAFEMLKAGRADYVLDYAPAASSILREFPIENLSVSTLGGLDIYLILAKSYPDAEGMMRRLEAIAQTLDVEGILRGTPPGN